LRTFGPVAVGIVAWAVAGAAPPVAPDPLQLARDIGNEGPAAVVERLWRTGTYQEVLQQMASGSKQWVALAPQLAQGADAAAAEGLGIALAEALPRNPASVLAVLDPARPALSPARICGVPFIEGTTVDIPAYVRDSTAAVSAVTDDRLQAAKVACLAALRS